MSFKPSNNVLNNILSETSVTSHYTLPPQCEPAEPIVHEHQTTETQTINDIKNIGSFLVVYRIHVISFIAVSYSIFLAMLLKYQHLLSFDVESLYLNKIFIPLLGYELIEVIYSPPPTVSNFQRFILAGTRSKFIHTYLRMFARFVKLMKDLVLYFVFFTITYHILAKLI